MTTLTALCESLRSAQRERVVLLGTRNKLANRLRAVVASKLGYHARLEPAERDRYFKEAEAVIDLVRSGQDAPFWNKLIRTSLDGIAAFDDLKGQHEEHMVEIAGGLPVALWVAQPEQRGFGLLFLAIVVGEAGDLGGYPGPMKLWRRMGCAPYSFGGKTLMGSTWKSGKEGKLPAEEWSLFGYSPRRRSIAYLVGDNLVKQNQRRDRETKEVAWVGPYRQRYDHAKTAYAARHPDARPARAHAHARLLAAKELLKRLWKAWTGR